MEKNLNLILANFIPLLSSGRDVELSAGTPPFGVSLGKSLHLLVFLVVNGVSGAGLLMEGMRKAEFSLACQELLSTPGVDGAQEVQKE